MAAKLGIFAGGGELPLRIIEACRARERAVFVLAFEGAADPAVVVERAACLGQAGRCRRGVAAAARARRRGGRLRRQRQRPSLLSLRPDWRAAKFFARVGYRALGDDGLLSAVIREFESEGFRVIGADDILGSRLGAARAARPPHARCAGRGRHRRRFSHRARAGRARYRPGGGGAAGPRARCRGDRGHRCAASPAARRCVAKARAACWSRRRSRGRSVAPICRRSARRTVEAAAAAGLRGIAIEAGASLVLDRAALVAAADRTGLFVVGVAPP